MLPLKRRSSGIYAVRLFVPERLRPYLGRGEVHRSTGCRELGVAKIVAAQIVQQWHALMLSARHMNEDELSRLPLSLIGVGHVAAVEAAAEAGVSISFLLSQWTARRAPFFLQAKGLKVRAFDVADRLERDDVGQIVSLDTTGLDAQQDNVVSSLVRIYFPDDAAAVLQSASGHAVEFLSAPGDHDSALMVCPPVRLTPEDVLVARHDAASLLGAAFRQHAFEVRSRSFHESSPEGPVDHGLATRSYSGRTVNDLIQEYIKRRAWGEVSGDTRERAEQALSALSELAGHLSLGELSREHLRSVMDELSLVPADRHLVQRLHAGDERLTWKALISLAESKALSRLTPNALSRLLEGIEAVFKWAVKETWLTQSPAEDLAAEASKRSAPNSRAASARQPFSPQELGLIFGASWFRQGYGEATRAGRVGKYKGYRPYYYWLPLLGLFAGGRINELSQLYLDDIKQSSGDRWYLDFNLDGEDKVDDDDDSVEPDASGKRLKTASSKRQVPLHPEILRAGFLEYVRALKERGYARLFPELTFSHRKGYGRGPTKWFNEQFLGKKLGLVRDGTPVFHSLRHNFATGLEHADVPSTARKQLMGHALFAAGSETAASYVHGRAADELAPQIDKLKHPCRRSLASMSLKGCRRFRTLLLTTS